MKRFKHKENRTFKQEQIIYYPINDLEVENKKYDLYGVINHYSNIYYEHYTSIIKNEENKWVLLDGKDIKEIEEKEVINSNAYILVYISKESPYNFDYIKMMKSLINNVKINKENGEIFMIEKDRNYFKYEPVDIELNGKNNMGYVMEENIENYDKNFVKVKYDSGEEWINKSKVKKILNLKEKINA